MMPESQIELYADGGVIRKNPSTIGGTWAFRIVANGMAIAERSGVITPQEACLPAITNNLTEMLAVVRGLALLSLTPQFCGTVYSDSMVTLGRIFLGWKWSEIPPWLHQEFRTARAGLRCWDQVRFVLLDGHPTKAHLDAGKGKRGHAVSAHNVWCDHECGRVGAQYKLLEGIR